MGYAFISYGSEHQATADAMWELLNQNGISAWMVPGDLPTDSEYAQAVEQAVEESACVVLMVLDRERNSEWAIREISRAFFRKKNMIPLSLENVELREERQYLLRDNRIIAFRPINGNTPEIRTMLDQLRAICGSEGKPAPQAVPQNTVKKVPAYCPEDAPKEEKKDSSTKKEDPQFCYEEGRRCFREKNYTKGIEWFRKAAEQNHAEAQFMLGECYNCGLGVEVDEAQAVEWYRKAVEQNHAEAQYRLGDCYYYGWGVEKDEAQGVEWYRKAAKQNHAKAQYRSGVCYYYGWGVEKDKAQAVEWYRKAAAQGVDNAREKLREMGVEE